MAGRLAWILAGGAAIVGGMVFQDDWFKFESREHDREVAEAVAEAKAGKDAIVARVVDECFPTALGGLDCWILSGRHPGRLLELLRDGRTRGTRLRASASSRG